MQALFDFIVGLIQLAIFLGIVVAIIAIWGYNSLRGLAENVKEAQSNVDIAVRKKISLVNQLIDVAGKYMDRESVVMLKVSQDATEAATGQLYQQTGTVLSTIQGMAQKFPDLKSSQQYMKLADAIAQSENDVQNWRLRCNSAIKQYNTRRSALPHALYASMLGFRPASYLELETVESSDASVQRQIIADDGDRLNELLGMAGTKVLGATKTLAAQGKELAPGQGARREGRFAGAGRDGRALGALAWRAVHLSGRCQDAAWPGVPRRARRAVPGRPDHGRHRRAGSGLEGVDEVRQPARRRRLAREWHVRFPCLVSGIKRRQSRRAHGRSLQRPRADPARR